MEEQRLLKKKRYAFEKDTKHQQATICNELADLYYREGKYDKALQEYKEEATLHKTLNRKMQYGIANRMIGEIYSNLAEFDKALYHENIHLNIAREEKNELEEQRALASIGRTYLTKGIAISESDSEVNSSESLKEAYYSFTQSLNIAKNLKNISRSEQIDMRARLLLNIGLVYEHQGLYDKANEFMQNSIKLCRDNDIYEQLHHGYYTLGLMKFKETDYAGAISSLNSAIEIASRLSDRASPMCATLLAKAEVLIKTADFSSAKNILLKAYKEKSPNIEERKIIENNLKVVAAMCKIEDELIVIPDYEYKKKKTLYEKMGDGACDLKNYTKAIDYYKKMLECAEANGETGKDLIPVYVSLAQTYKDAKDYSNAIEYFQKDLTLNRKNPVESCTTLMNIAEVFDLNGNSYEEINMVLQRALKQARLSDVKKLEVKVLKQVIFVQKKFNKFNEANQVEKQLVQLNYEDSSSDSETSGQETPNIGDEIDIHDISDLSSDNEDINNQSERPRRRMKTFKIRKNEKGESQLHLACIKGDGVLVKRLIEQGHDIDVRDHSGWLPLHEACNHGHLHIVKILLENGSLKYINDKGGLKCSGITPLHDACTNAHFDIIEYLLDNGASPLMQIDTGETPYELMRQYVTKNNLDSEERTKYDLLASRMLSALEKAGRTIGTPIKHSEIKAYKTISPRKITPAKNEKVPVPTTNPTPSKIGTLRNAIDVDADDLDPQMPSCSYVRQVSSVKRNLNRPSSEESDEELGKAGREYKELITGLRTRNNTKYDEKPKRRSPRLNKKKSLGSGFMDPDEVDADEWLDDDIGHVGRKRKRSSVNSRVKQTFVDNIGSRNNKTKSTSIPPPPPPPPSPPIGNNEDSNDNSDLENIYYNTKNISENKRRRSNQSASLFDSGFTNNRQSPIDTGKPGVTLVNEKIKSKRNVRQSKLNKFVSIDQHGTYDVYESVTGTTAALLDQQPQPQQLQATTTISPPKTTMMRVKIWINEKMWIIPVSAEDLHNKTIAWLATEASKRYYRAEGIEPTLQLKTKEGGILANEDPLSLIYVTTRDKFECLLSEVLTWILPPITHRYIEACNSNKLDVVKDIHDSLALCECTQNFKINVLPQDQSIAVFRAITRQTNLQCITLNELNLKNSMPHLCSALPSLTHLRTLNLKLANLNFDSVRLLSELFDNTVHTKPILQNLIELNLSQNNLGDQSLTYLVKICENLKLKSLDLACCGFTENLFENGYSTLNLDHLETLNIKGNQLNSDGVITFLSFLNFNRLVNLNVGFNQNVRNSGILREISTLLADVKPIKLKYLNVGECHVSDVEIFELNSNLSNAHELEELDLSLNDKLTFVTLRRMFQKNISVQNVNFQGCDNIMENFQHFPYENEHLKYLSINFNHQEELNFLTTIWRNQWQHRAKITSVEGICFIFSVEDIVFV